MTYCTLIFLLQKDEILLAMQKRGFGIGRWNGPGGKIEQNETIEQALVRECQEEIAVTPIDYRKAAVIDCVFPRHTDDIQVHVYTCTQWQGEPQESEEMAPQWFKRGDLPYDQMWQDDKFWLPQVLEGKKLYARFNFDKDKELVDTKIREVKSL